MDNSHRTHDVFAHLTRVTLLSCTVVVSFALSGCGDPPRRGSGDASVVDGSRVGRDGSPPVVSSPSAPRILSLRMSSGSLSPRSPVTITAVVTDPDGIEDLIGGELFDVASGAVYGSFMTSAGEGAYSLVVTWDQANAMATIDAPGAGVSRDLRARFFDTAGNTSEENVSLLLRCQDDESVSACDGRCNGTTRCGSSCVDTTSNDNNCGACGFRCMAPLPEYAASCTNSVCTWYAEGSVRQSCDTFCTSQGGECLPGSPTARYCRSTCSSTFSTYFDCATTPPATSTASGSGDFNFLQCKCGLSATGVLCAPGSEDTDERCSDGCSNDGDRYIDCADFDCNGTVVCSR